MVNLLILGQRDNAMCSLTATSKTTVLPAVNASWRICCGRADNDIADLVTG